MNAKPLKLTNIFIFKLFKHFEILVFAAVISLVTGCNIHVTAGSKPNLSILNNTLKQGVSTQQDVQKHLGEPSGKGLEMLPFMNKPRLTWTYYYEEGDMQDDRRLFLFVFFAEQKFDGYMWFSSLPEFKVDGLK